MNFNKIFKKYIFIFALFNRAMLGNNWTGFSSRVQVGLTANYGESDKSIDKGVGPLFGLGFELSKLTTNRLYFSFDLGFDYYISSKESEYVNEKTIFSFDLFGNKLPLKMPTTYIHLGYAINEKFIVTGGLVNYWGLFWSIRHTLKDHISIEFRNPWFLDKLFYKNGLHNTYAVVSLSYKF